METKDLTKLVCKDIFGKHGKEQKNCSRTIKKAIKTTEAVITIANLF